MCAYLTQEARASKTRSSGANYGFASSSYAHVSTFSSTKPLSLLRIAPSLILEAVDRCATGVMPKPVLMNGTSYFLGPLLSWTLFGVVKELLSHIQRSGYVYVLFTLRATSDRGSGSSRCCI
jgi:hypothetical protein